MPDSTPLPSSGSPALVSGRTHRSELEVRVFPWRPRRRRIEPPSPGDGVPDVGAVDDVAGVAVMLAVWVVLVVAAPVAVVLVSVVLLPFEVLLVAALALLLLAVRFAGLVPWTVGVTDLATGAHTTERYRFIGNAVRRVREVNGGGGVSVRWSWT